MREKVPYTGTIGEIVETTQDDGRVFERYRRAPGTRIIIISQDSKILVTKEYRGETGNVDLRLPGGKVRDTIHEYRELIDSGQSIMQAATEGAIKEAAEETGLSIQNPKLVTVSRAGATVEWDLYYFVVTEFSELESGQSLKQGEKIEIGWMTLDEIEDAIVNKRMQEWRSVGVLLGLIKPRLQQT